jgi:hypothetical protein
MKRKMLARREDTEEAVPLWREQAVEQLFAAYWDEVYDPDSRPDINANAPQTPNDWVTERKRHEWEQVFVRLGTCGVWEILFPSEEYADQVYEIAEHFVRSGITVKEVRGDARRAQRIAKQIRRELDAHSEP